MAARIILKLGNLAKNLAIAAAALFALSWQAQAAEMTISAAASLTNAFNELAKEFEKEQANLKIFTNYAASNPLLKQIVEGAPVDVFASADEETMNKAVAAKVVNPDTRVTFALNDLVLIVPKGQEKPASLADLVKLKRIAAGDPASVPAGRYAKSALENAKQYDALKDKFISGSNVRQVLEYVAGGEVDAGFVYGTDAKQMEGQVDVALVVPTSTPVSYPIAVATTGNNPEMGAEFIKFVQGDAAQKILQKYGFVIP